PFAALVTGPDGKLVPVQFLGAPDVNDGHVTIAFLAKAPSVGFAAYLVQPNFETNARSTLKVSDHELENDFYTVKLDAKGDVSSIFDKQAKKELLSAPARLA